ncbi:MAG: glycoside hydrolase family 76 protein [Dysgonamonadaceae bacterium]
MKALTSHTTYTMILLFILLTLSLPVESKDKIPCSDSNLEKARQTLNSLYKYYSNTNPNLLRENYPPAADSKVTYLASEQPDIPNEYSYLWPYSGVFSAVTALYITSGEQYYKDLLLKKALPGLNEYLDKKRIPTAYSSYIISAPVSDRFYDDNLWIGIDFIDLYIYTHDNRFLDKAKMVWKFIESGTDKVLGGGIYWCEQKKESKNTCSNAPAAVLALKLYRATQDSSFLFKGKELYDWTKKHLQDPEDYLYYDNINLHGNVDKKKYSYNSGQMMQAAALLYIITKDTKYLNECKNIAAASYSYFFSATSGNSEKYRILNDGNIWFAGIMLRGYIELYHINKEDTYIKAYCSNLSSAWNQMRDQNGLFNTDWNKKKEDSTKWLLTQAAFVEMYARLAELSKLINSK